MSWWIAGATAASAAWGAYSDSKGNRQDARMGYGIAGVLGTYGAGSYAAGGSAAAGSAGGSSGGSSTLGSIFGSGSSSGGTGAGASGGSSGWAGALSKGIGGLGQYMGAQEQAQGYQNASDILGGLGAQGAVASSMADPFQQYRGKYASQLDSILSGETSIKEDPGYQFQYNEGQRAVERSAAVRGMGNSGNVMAALQQRGQDVASQQYGTIIDRLTNLAGAGSQNAIAGGSAYSNLVGRGMEGQASAAVGVGNSNAAGTSGLMGGIGSAIGSFF